MNFFNELLDFFCKAAYLFAVFGAVAGILGFVRWSADATERAKKINKRKAFGGGGGAGQTLGRASAAELNAARMARIANNRFQMQATMAKESKRLIQRKQQVRAATSSPPPRNYSSLMGATAGPSPRSVSALPTIGGALPKELRPESTVHFFLVGGTKFIALPTQPQLDMSVAILGRLAQEFMPIIRKRGFNVRSVSELCCCGDGLEYELGGEKRSVAAGELIAGHESETIAGYNGKLFNRLGQAEYVIHLRLRTVDDHHKFMDYEEDIVDSMAHELAHCVHEDHGPEFWDLMEDILADRAKILEDIKNGVRKCDDPVTASKEQFGGFNIYRPVSGQMRSWNGQIAVKA